MDVAVTAGGGEGGGATAGDEIGDLVVGHDDLAALIGSHLLTLTHGLWGASPEPLAAGPISGTGGGQSFLDGIGRCE